MTMKYWIATTIMTLSLSSQAFGDYTCSNETEILNVKILDISADSLNPTKTVFATLESADQKQTFSGNLSHAGSSIAENYDLEDEQGQAVDLKISTTTESYGGRCGRCSPAPTLTSYAKLTLANGEVHDFVCK